MKGKHVLNQPDETDLESDHVEKSIGQVMEGDREEEITFEGNQSGHISIRFPFEHHLSFGKSITAADIASHASSDEFQECIR